MEPKPAGKFLSLWQRVRQRVKSPTLRSPRGWLVVEFILFAVLASFLVSRLPLRNLPEYAVGDTARMETRNITPVELIVIDPERTERLRQEEAQRIPPVFLYDQSLEREVDTDLRSAFEQTRQKFLDALDATFKRRQLSARETTSSRFRQFVLSFQTQKPPVPVTLMLAQTWAQGEPGKDIQTRLSSKLGSIMRLYIRSDDLPMAETPQDVRLLPLMDQDVSLSPEMIEQRGRIVDWGSIFTLTNARRELRRSLTPEELPYSDWLTSLVKVNVLYDEELTQQIRAQRTNQITATTRYEPRQLIVERGETITPRLKAALDQLRAQTVGKPSGLRLAGLFIISLILFFALWRFAHRTRVYSLSPMKVFSLAGFAVVFQLAVSRVGVEIADIIGYRFFGDIDSPLAYQYAIPFATAALLTVLLLESRIAVCVGLMVSLFTVLLTEDAGLSIYAAVSGLIGVYGVGRYQQRGAITRVGIMISVGNALMTLILMAVKVPPHIVFGPALFSMFCGLLGGLFAAALTSYTLPLGESLFDVPTDVKLLELSNVDLPLLKRLAIEAPGTYQHSLIVAALAEAAAKAVGANSLLVRIGSYYHDVGKLASPQMYVENQRNFNPHELMTPEESAQAIIRHVSEGIGLAEEAGMPKAVIDLIPQHHGTRRLHYFYMKARQQAEERGEEVDERAFRYTGPKPQSIEAAIVMMADSAEASSRSLRDRTPENTDRLLTKVIETIVTDGQLDECNLRMRDLKVIKASFLQTLSNVHHQRIQYPGFTEEELSVLPVANYETVWSEPAVTASSRDSLSAGDD